MPPGQTKPWWDSPKFFTLSLPVAGLDQGQPTRWHQSDVTDMDSGDLIKGFDFVLQCKSPLNKFLTKHISVDKLPLIKTNKLLSAEAMNFLPQPQLSNYNPISSVTTPASTAKPTQRPAMDNDVYVHLVSEVKAVA